MSGRIRTQSAECWKYHPECHVEMLKEAVAEARGALLAIAGVYPKPMAHPDAVALELKRRIAHDTLQRINEVMGE